VFTYTIRDGDGDLSHTTLTLALAQGNSVPGNFNIPAEGGAGALVDEAGLASGSTPAATSETTSGTITFGFRRTAVGRRLADARICQDGLRNRVIDQEPFGPSVVQCRKQEHERRNDPKKKSHSYPPNGGRQVIGRT
jgi:hypothetical protein